MARTLDLDVYTHLIEVAAHSTVIARSIDNRSVGEQVAASGADKAIIDEAIASNEAISALSRLIHNGQLQAAAILSGSESKYASSPAANSFTVLTDVQQLTRWLHDQSDADTNDGSPAAKLPSLTKREREVWLQIARGKSVRQVAEGLQLAESTVDSHKSRLMKKLRVHKSVDLVRLAIRNGLLDL